MRKNDLFSQKVIQQITKELPISREGEYKPQIK